MRITEEQKEDLSLFGLSSIAFPICIVAGFILPRINNNDWTASLFICFPMAAFFAFSFFFYSVYFFCEITKEIKRRKKIKRCHENKKVA